MFYAKIYGPYNFYLFQFKFWIHFRLTKTESIKEVPNWHWRRFMNKLFLVAWGLTVLYCTWPVNSFYLFVNYFTVISLRKLNFLKREHLNFYQGRINLEPHFIRIASICYKDIWTGARWGREVALEKILLKSRNSIFENHKNGDHLDKLYLHTVVVQRFEIQNFKFL